MELRFADWAENSRIKTITPVVAGDEIHPIGDYDLFQVTPVTTRHRRLCISDFLTLRRRHENIARAIAHYVARHCNNSFHILGISRKNKSTQRICGEANGNDVAPCRLKQLSCKR